MTPLHWQQTGPHQWQAGNWQIVWTHESAEYQVFKSVENMGFTCMGFQSLNSAKRFCESKEART